MMSELDKHLDSLALPAIASADPSRTYLWMFGDREWSSFTSPLTDAHRYPPEREEPEHTKLLPLAIVPERFDGTTHVLFKEHEQWTAVLPSHELAGFRSQIEVTTATAQFVRAKFELSRAPRTDWLGAVISFKHSPTKNEDNCYIFPLIAVRSSIPESGHTPEFARGGRSWRYLSKQQLEMDPQLYSGANADVHRALEKVDPSWTQLASLAYEFDLAVSFAKDKRPFVREVISILQQLRPELTVFEDDSDVRGGDYLPLVLPQIYRHAARRVAVVSSRAYKQRTWPSLEYRSIILENAERRGRNYVIPIVTDGIELGELEGYAFLEPDEDSPASLAAELAALL